MKDFTDFTLRFWQPPDRADLLEMFSIVFGDPPETAETFQRTFLTAPEACILAAVPEEGRPEGRPVAACYCLPGPALCIPGQQRTASVYLYAVGCLPAWRGKGIGMKMAAALFAEAGRQAPVSCIIPATEGLLQAYNRIRPLSPLGHSRIAEAAGTEIGSAEALPAERISWQDYARRREDWLASYPHAAYPDSYYSLAEAYGNVFLALPGALAAAFPLEDKWVVSELLCPFADPARALAGIAAACPARQYEIRTPAFFPGPGEIRPFAYCHDTAGNLDAPDHFWFPFALE